MSKVCDQLRQIEADANALVIKLHNYHWHVGGSRFKTVHEYTEEAYDEVFEIFDEVAERVLQLGEKPIVDINELVSTAKIAPNNNTHFSDSEVVSNMVSDYEYLAESFRTLAKLADEADDRVTAAMCDDKLSSIEKRLWMLKAMLDR